MRRFMRLPRVPFASRAATNLALVAMLGAPLAACGKKEEPAPPAPQAIADTTAPPPVEPQKAPTPVPEPSEAKVAPAERKQSVAPSARPALTTRAVAEIPEDFMAVVGTEALSSLVATVGGLAAKRGVELPPDALAEFINQAKVMAGIDLSWLDTGKPVRFSVPNPKAHEGGFLIVLAIKEGAKPEPTMFPSAVAGDKGHWAKADIQGRAAWIDQVDGHLVFASSPELLKHTDFIKSLLAWTPSSSLVADTSVANLRKAYAAELAEARQFTEAIAQMGTAQSAAQLNKLTTSGFAVVDGLDRMGFALDPTGDFPRLAVTLNGSPKSPVAEFAADIQGRKASLAAATPSDAWLAFGYNSSKTDPAKALAAIEPILDEAFAERPGVPMLLDAAARAELKRKILRVIELSGEENAMWLRAVDGRPFLVESLSDTPDGEAFASALIDVGDLIFSKAWIQMRQQMVAQGMQASQLPTGDKLADFIGFFNQNLGAFGVSLASREATSPEGAVGHSFEIGLSWDKLPVRDPNIATLSKLVGADIGLGVSGRGKFVSMVLGPTAAQRAATLAGQGAAPSGDTWAAQLTERPFYALLRPVQVLSLLSEHVPRLASIQPILAKYTDDPVVVSGQSDGETVTVELQVSMEQIDLFIALFTLPTQQ